MKIRKLVFIRSLYDNFQGFYALSTIPIYAYGRDFSKDPLETTRNSHIVLRNLHIHIFRYYIEGFQEAFNFPHNMPRRQSVSRIFVPRRRKRKNEENKDAELAVKVPRGVH